MATSVQQRTPGHWPAPGTIHGSWTARDRATLPDDGLRYEILDGSLVVSPSPTPIHQIVSSNVFSLLTASRPAGHVVLYAPLDLLVDQHTVVEPDLLVMRDADVAPQRLTGTPVLVVEIVSPSSARIDRTLKYDIYARAGVPQYWIVDPGDEHTSSTVDIYDLNGDTYRRRAHASGDQTITVTGPITTTVTPTRLNIPPR